MDVDEFRADLSAEVRNAAINSGQSASAAFAEKIVGYMREAEYLNGDFQEAFFIGKNPKRRSNLRVDGWLQDEADDSIALFVVHYGDDAELAETLRASVDVKFKFFLLTNVLVSFGTSNGFLRRTVPCRCASPSESTSANLAADYPNFCGHLRPARQPTP